MPRLKLMEVPSEHTQLKPAAGGDPSSARQRTEGEHSGTSGTASGTGLCGQDGAAAQSGEAGS